MPFTLRVEWERGGETEYTMYECMTYQKQRQAADGRIVITLDQDTDTPRELLLDEGHTVYVMNAQGQTCDTIRNQPQRRRRDGSRDQAVRT